MGVQKEVIDQLAALLAAYEKLFLAARTTLEMSELVDDDEAVVHPEVLEDLNDAYQKVYRQLQNKGKNNEIRRQIAF